MKLFKVLAAVVLIGTATANYTPDPPADRQRGAQLLLTDNADCSEGGTRNIYGGECFNIQTLFFAISEFDGDLVNPDIGCITTAHQDLECGDSSIMLLQANVCYPAGFPNTVAVMVHC